MSKKKEAPIPLSRNEIKRRDKLSEAVRCALVQQRPALRISAGLVALGLATHAAPALAVPFPAEIELSSLLPAQGGDGSSGFILNGIDPQDRLGRSVSTAGDVNGDGIDDLLIGAYTASPGGRASAGESYVVFGRVQSGGGFPAQFRLSSLLPANGGDGSAGFVLNGIDPGDFSGFSVSAAGDVNGDGIDDLIIGANQDDAFHPGGAGEIYVVFGREQTAGGFPAVFELSSLLLANGGDGSEGFVLYGIDPADKSGHSVSGVGDVNGDGVNDVLVGATHADPGGRDLAGESYVVFGRDQTAFPAEFELSSLLLANGGDGSEGFVLNGIDARDFSSRSVSGAGDVNGDGIDDLLMGANSADPGGRLNAGETYVIFGRDEAVPFPAEFEPSSLLLANGADGSKGFVLNGIDAYDFSGHFVSAAGDVNGDGNDDLMVGAVGAKSGGRILAGETYIVFGRDQTAFAAELELSSLMPANGGDGSAGFILRGIDGGDRSGYSVSAAGDVNGDGIDDLIVGAPGADPGSREYAGESYVVFGQNQTAFRAELHLVTLLSANGGDGSEGFVLNGIDAYDYSGSSVSAAGDLNDDGIDDLLVGAKLADPGGRMSAGESYVVFGRRANTSGAMCEGTNATIVGTNSNDDIRGTSQSDVINALAGNDTIRGLGGDDIICGGQGNDVIYGNAGNNTMFGQDGSDTLIGGGGIDLLSGGPGDDVLRGGGANDQLFGDEGNDNLAGGNGNDHHDGGADTDNCNGGGGNGDTAANCEKRTKIP